MENAFGLLFVNLGLLFGAAIIGVIGVLIFSKGGNSTGRSIAGAVLTAIAVAAALQAVYIQGFRWLNPLLLIILVLLVGVVFVRQVDGVIATGLGVFIIIVAVVALDTVRPLNGVQIGGSATEAFKTGWSGIYDAVNLDRIFGDEQREPRNNRNQQNRGNGQQNGAKNVQNR